MDNLYDYLLHFNIYTKKWNAFKREKVVDYFNGSLDKKEIISDSDQLVVIKKIKKLK